MVDSPTMKRPKIQHDLPDRNHGPCPMTIRRRLRSLGRWHRDDGGRGDVGLSRLDGVLEGGCVGFSE